MEFNQGYGDAPGYTVHFVCILPFPHVGHTVTSRPTRRQRKRSSDRCGQGKNADQPSRIWLQSPPMWL